MATHDWVVRKIARYHLAQGDDVFADHCPGFRKPPTSYGPRGAGYVPDIWVRNEGLAYEVEPYNAAKHSISQLKAFARDPEIRTFRVVLCSGSEDGTDKQAKVLTNRGLIDGLEGDIEIVNWQTLFDDLDIPRP
jgi:hypothetical protein